MWWQCWAGGLFCSNGITPFLLSPNRLRQTHAIPISCLFVFGSVHTINPRRDWEFFGAIVTKKDNRIRDFLNVLPGPSSRYYTCSYQWPVRPVPLAQFTVTPMILEIMHEYCGMIGMEMQGLNIHKYCNVVNNKPFPKSPSMGVINHQKNGIVYDCFKHMTSFANDRIAGCHRFDPAIWPTKMRILRTRIQKSTTQLYLLKSGKQNMFEIKLHISLPVGCLDLGC